MPAPKRGDIVVIEYRDLTGEVNGSPEEADVARGTWVGFWWGFRGTGKKRTVVCTSVLWSDGSFTDSSVWPFSVVDNITVLKRAKK